MIYRILGNILRDLDLAASVNYHLFGKINPYVYLIEVNNCILITDNKTCEKVLRLKVEHGFNNKSESRKILF